MRKKIIRGLIYLALGFVLLFGLRLTYGYLIPQAQSYEMAYHAESAGAAEGMRRNYASERVSVSKMEKSAPVDGGVSYSVDQKYEKIATMVSRTQKFEEDEKRARDLTKKFDALIQSEQNSGLAGNRDLNLVIGVPPEHFDAMVAEIRTLGRITSFRVDKTDKTNEYKKLNANREALQKTHDAYIALKEHGGSIEELTTLEEKILENDQQIQATGVELGDYDAGNEFCTVRFALAEEGGPARISFGHRVIVALYWSIKAYLALLGMLLLGSLFLLVIAMVIERLRRMSTTRTTTEV
ncbi:MAG: DUF4349 domain-containing protein [Bacteroidota bacterium]